MSEHVLEIIRTVSKGRRREGNEERMATAADYQLLIEGKWVDGGAGSYRVMNPATSQVVAEAPEATEADARWAAAAAK